METAEERKTSVECILIWKKKGSGYPGLADLHLYLQGKGVYLKQDILPVEGPPIFELDLDR